jgi:hypothetical protein
MRCGNVTVLECSLYVLGTISCRKHVSTWDRVLGVEDESGAEVLF